MDITIFVIIILRRTYLAHGIELLVYFIIIMDVTIFIISIMRRIDLAQGIELLVGRFTGKYGRDTISAFVIQTLILISPAAS